MKHYLLGLFNWITMMFILVSFIAQNYMLGTILCLLTITSIFVVVDLPEYIKLKREAKEIEDIINRARDEINKEFIGV